MKADITRLGHAQAETLLPAFVHGRLGSALLRGVQEHIASCPRCARRHREELELVEAMRHAPPAVEALLTSSARARNREQLLQLIAADEARPAAQPARHSRPPRAALHRSATLGLGLAATLLVGALLPTHMTGTDPGPVMYRTQGAVTPGAAIRQGATFRVVFRADASAQSIQQLLLLLHANVVDGPTAAGVYTLAFPDGASDSAALLARLRSQPDIVLAERSSHRDG